MASEATKLFKELRALGAHRSVVYFENGGAYSVSAGGLSALRKLIKLIRAIDKIKRGSQKYGQS